VHVDGAVVGGVVVGVVVVRWLAVVAVVKGMWVVRRS
jgi:hypothetical protein